MTAISVLLPEKLDVGNEWTGLAEEIAIYSTYCEPNDVFVSLIEKSLGADCWQ